jgi:hypothetical protein
MAGSGTAAIKKKSWVPGATWAETKEEERFLSAQADPFTGVKGEEEVGLLRSK